MDNCTCENKRKYVFGYVECLLEWISLTNFTFHSCQLDIRTKTLTNKFHAPPDVFEQIMPLLSTAAWSAEAVVQRSDERNCNEIGCKYFESIWEEFLHNTEPPAILASPLLPICTTGSQNLTILCAGPRGERMKVVAFIKSFIFVTCSRDSDSTRHNNPVQTARKMFWEGFIRKKFQSTVVW